MIPYNKSLVGIHAAIGGQRNARDLAALKRKYAEYDRRNRMRWWHTAWCAIVLAGMVFAGVVRDG